MNLQEEDMDDINSAYDYLLEGIDALYYERDGSTTNKKRTLWFDRNQLRVCVDDQKMNSSPKNKLSIGICLRDIADIRLGTGSYNFKNIEESKKDSDCCFSIIGSERTMSMQTLSKVMHYQYCFIIIY